MITPVSVKPKVQPCVGSVPEEASTVFLVANQPTIARAAIMGMNRPIQMTIPVPML